MANNGLTWSCATKRPIDSAEATCQDSPAFTFRRTVSLAQLTESRVKDGAYDIYREGDTRYAAVTFNVRGRDLGTTVEDAIKKIKESEVAAGLFRRLVR